MRYSHNRTRSETSPGRLRKNVQIGEARPRLFFLETLNFDVEHGTFSPFLSHPARPVE